MILEMGKGPMKRGTIFRGVYLRVVSLVDNHTHCPTWYDGAVEQ